MNEDYPKYTRGDTVQYSLNNGYIGHYYVRGIFIDDLYGLRVDEMYSIDIKIVQPFKNSMLHEALPSKTIIPIHHPRNNQLKYCRVLLVEKFE